MLDTTSDNQSQKGKRPQRNVYAAQLTCVKLMMLQRVSRAQTKEKAVEGALTNPAKQIIP